MLTRSDWVYTKKDGECLVDRLGTPKHAHYPAIAEGMLSIYRNGTGRTRDALHADVRALFHDESHCPPARISAFCGLLDDAARYEESPVSEAAALRLRVWEAAAPYHPVVAEPQNLLAHSQAVVRERVCQAVGLSWEEIQRGMFADVIGHHVLSDFTPGYETPKQLLRRYNEAQVQVALYSATEMRIGLSADYRSLVIAVKLAGLMYEARKTTDGLELRITGPASLMRHTRRYGYRMATVLPTLLACQGKWSLSAPLRIPGNGRATLKLTEDCKLTSSRSPADPYDSRVERDFAAKWGSKQEGWVLERESEPTFIRQKAVFPDFTFRHSTGVAVLLEIVGYWTEAYLRGKAEALGLLRGQRMILAVPDSEEGFNAHGMPVIRYKRSLAVGAVLEILRGFLSPEK